MAHSKLKYPIGLLSENIQESIIGGLGQLNITGKVKECKNTEYSDYNLYSCRLAEEESKHLLFPCNVNSLQL
jgi:hypothetical protein